MDVFGGVDWMCMDRNGVNFLLHNVWNTDFVMNFVRMWDFNLLHDRNFNNFDFRDLLCVMLMVGVIWIFGMDVIPVKRNQEKLTR